MSYMYDTSEVTDALRTKGWFVLRNFIKTSSIDSNLIDFLYQSPIFKDGVIKDIPSFLMKNIRDRVESIVPNLASIMGLNIDKNNFEYCAIKIDESKDKPILKTPFNIHSDPKVAPGGVLNWHLDHFSFYLHKDHINWLICYLPIVKMRSDYANVAIVSDDVIKKLDPESHSLLTGRGAIRFRKVETDTVEWFKLRFSNDTVNIGDWYAIDDYDDTSMGWKLKFDPEEHKVIPELCVGDLLIMRADVMHRTSDSRISRVSVRCDAIPKNAYRKRTLIGLILLTLHYPFIGSKRAYALKSWLLWEWRKRLVLFSK